MKHRKYAQYLLLLAWISFSTTISAQVGNSITWANGFLSNNMGGCGLLSLNDSLLLTVNQSKGLTVDSSLVQIFRKTDLSKKREIKVPIDSGSGIGIFLFSGDTTYYFISQYYATLKKEELSVFMLAYPQLSFVPVFQNKFENTRLRTRNVGLFNGNLILMKANGSQSLDTMVLQKMDLTGNILKTVMHNDSINLGYYTLNRNYFFGPYQHPNNINQIVYGNYFECRVAVVDKTTLDTVSVMKPDPYHFTPMSTYVDGGYQLYPDRITCGGSMFLTYNLPFNPTFDWQYYFDSRSWSGDSLYELRLGKLGFADKSYAYTSSPAHNQHILAGSGPMNSLFEGPEYREVKLYRFNESGFIDSLLLYGNKNHVPLRLLAEPNGDLFMLSTFTDAWTTDSTYFQLDKIPAYLIGLIEDKVVSPKIIIYPNPTADIVRFDVGTMAITSIDVYCQEGQLLKHFKTPAAEGVTIADLPNNLYIFVLHLDDGTRVSSIVVKR
jgi:hypothetical protein